MYGTEANFQDIPALPAPCMAPAAACEHDAAPRTSAKADAETDAVLWADTLIHRRRTHLPKRLGGPGPDARQRHLILRAASAAPDHGQQVPWRLIEVSLAQRAELGQAFAQALRERDPTADATAQAQAAEKAQRAPWLLLVACSQRGGAPDIPLSERLLATGCAVQNMLLMAQAMELGAALTSGKAMHSEALKSFFALPDDELPVCFLSVGNIRTPRPERPRPAVEDYFRVRQP